MANKKGTKARFGSTRRLPPGRVQARYAGPDGLAHKAPFTFDTEGDAETWLSTIRADIVRDAWNPNSTGKHRSLTFGAYADRWLIARTLEARTREHYRALLDGQILPTFKAVPLRHVTPDLVREWHATTAIDTPTTRAHAYGLLRSILGQAEKDQLIVRNPAWIRGAGNSKRVRKIEPATLSELETLVAAMPAKYQLMTLLAAWCALRFGELAELRRGDVNPKPGVLHVPAAQLGQLPEPECAPRGQQ